MSVFRPLTLTKLQIRTNNHNFKELLTPSNSVRGLTILKYRESTFDTNY